MGFKQSYWRNNVLKKLQEEKKKITQLDLEPLIKEIKRKTEENRISPTNLPF